MLAVVPIQRGVAVDVAAEDGAVSRRAATGIALIPLGLGADETAVNLDPVRQIERDLFVARVRLVGASGNPDFIDAGDQCVLQVRVCVPPGVAIFASSGVDVDVFDRCCLSG